MAAQNEKDRQIWMVLALIMEELKKFRRISAVSTRNLPDLLFEAAGKSHHEYIAYVNSKLFVFSPFYSRFIKI